VDIEKERDRDTKIHSSSHAREVALIWGKAWKAFLQPSDPEPEDQAKAIEMVKLTAEAQKNIGSVNRPASQDRCLT